MKIVGSCQGANLKILLKLLDIIGESRSIKKAGVFVSDSMAFDKIEDSRLKDPRFFVLKEWEVFKRGRNLKPDSQKLNEYEEKIGDPVLWNVLLSDRRVFFGKKCKMKQDYKSRFAYHEMSGILQAALEDIEHFFDEINPDLVLSFGISNIGDYLFYRFAKARQIQFLQLKATKIANRVSFNDDAIELSSHIKDVYLLKSDLNDNVTNEARTYINEVRNKGVKYEGAILQRKQIDIKNIIMALARGGFASFRRKLNPIYRSDNHLEPFFSLQLHDKVLNPVKYRFQEYLLRKNILSDEVFQAFSPFVFFPLHFEPEVSIQVQGRVYQNQIELIRNIALNVPYGMFVLVKEHPRSKGFRPTAYYRKILEIPNVKLIKTEISTHQVIKKAALIAVISGSTGLEAAIMGRPVITFGSPVYNILPDNMVRHVENLNQLGFEIKDLLKNYIKDDSCLLNYLSSIISGSVPVNLYTVLLGKAGRFSTDDGTGNSELVNYQALAMHLSERIDRES